MKKVFFENIVACAVAAVLVLAGCSQVETVESINFDVGSVTMIQGDELFLSLQVVPETSKVIWASSDMSVVSVADNGKLLALSAGNAIISASAGNKSAQCVVCVVEAPQVGDYYYEDGSYSEYLEDGKKVLGVVFWTGNPAVNDPAAQALVPGCTHGLVIAIDEAGNGAWQDAVGSPVGKWADANSEWLSPDTDILPNGKMDMILGFNNTCVLKEYNEDPVNSDNMVAIVEVLAEFAQEYPAPASSSGWYVPSIKELSLICSGVYDGSIWDIVSGAVSNRDYLNSRISSAAGDVIAPDTSYWSSSESGISKAFELVFVSGNVSDTMKSYQYNKYRFVLAF